MIQNGEAEKKKCCKVGGLIGIRRKFTVYPQTSTALILEIWALVGVNRHSRLSFLKKIMFMFFNYMYVYVCAHVCADTSDLSGDGVLCSVLNY